MKILRGTRIVDLSHAVAGPFCTMILADLGADVVKVEPPGGDHFRPALGGAYHAAINRSKKGICLDLKQRSGKDALSRLLRTADVFVESFTPGTIDRLGFGYEAVKAIAPGVIYCSVSGFGQDGPYRDLPGYDVIAQAMSGIMMATGEPGRPPVRIAPSLIDMGTGMNLAIGILASLLDRQSTGEGRKVDVNLLETAISWMGAFIVQHAMTGEEPQRIGSALSSFAPYQVFTAADGPVFVGVSTQRFWQRFCQVLDLEDLVADPLYSDMSSRVKNREALNKIVAAALQGLTASEAIGRLREAGVPCAPVLSLGQALEDPHIKHRGLVASIEDPERGTIELPKTPIMCSGEMPKIGSAAPVLGQNTREILNDLGYSEAEIDTLVASGAALAVDR